MNVFETLIYEKKDHVAWVTLNRPKVMNIHNMAMRDDMIEVLNAIMIDEEIRVVVFKGAGDKAFCAGADLSEFLTAPPPTAAREVRFDTDLWDLFKWLPFLDRYVKLSLWELLEPASQFGQRGSLLLFYRE